MDEDISKLSPVDQEALLWKYLEAMSPDVRDAFIKVMNWMAFERPKDSEPVTTEQLAKWIEEVKQKDLQRPPSNAGTVVPFKKSDS